MWEVYLKMCGWVWKISHVFFRFGCVCEKKTRAKKVWSRGWRVDPNPQRREKWNYLYSTHGNRRKPNACWNSSTKLESTCPWSINLKDTPQTNKGLYPRKTECIKEKEGRTKILWTLLIIHFIKILYFYFIEIVFSYWYIGTKMAVA